MSRAKGDAQIGRPAATKLHGLRRLHEPQVAKIVAAFAAGWSLVDEPMKAAVLFLLPAIVLGAARLFLDDASASAGALVFALVLAVMFTAVFTHIGAGVALRRRNAEQRG